MAKINRPIHQPTTHHPRALQTPPLPSEPVPQPTQDSFLKKIAREVYESHPLVMLCTKPKLREWASELPVIKEVADAVCPVVLGETTKK